MHFKSGYNRNKVPMNHGSSMFGDDSDHEEQIGKPKNTKRTEAVAVNVAMEFQDVSVANNEVYKGPDDWRVGFVKFKVDVRAMNSEENKTEVVLGDLEKVVRRGLQGAESFP